MTPDARAVESPGADTIVAVASPPGPAARGLVRLSGPAAGRFLAACFRDATGARFDPACARGFWRGRFDDGHGTQPALLLWMPGPRSYTREDVGELHLPGAQPLLAAALERLVALGARPAGPGEFTRRAFLSGRIDLTRAEGVLELVAARNEDEARAAAALLSGGLATRVGDLRERLSDLRALCEASLDFDADDTGHVDPEALAERADEARAALGEALAFEVRRQPPSALPRIVLTGRPNAGKSTLFNALLRREEALVGPRAGTTRDRVAGLVEGPSGPLLLVDTPGLEAAEAGLERDAQAGAARERAGADLLLWLVDAGDPDRSGALAAFDGAPDDPPRLLVWSKAEPGAPPAPPGAFAVSAASGAGLATLAAAVETALGRSEDVRPDAGRPPGSVSPARELFARHRQALLRAREALDEARAGLGSGAPLDLVAEALRGANDALDSIEGHTSPEDLLDRIFARFCLGK